MKYYHNQTNHRKGFCKFRPQEWQVVDAYLDLCFAALHDRELQDEDTYEFACTPNERLGRNKNKEDTTPFELLGSLMSKRYKTLPGSEERADLSKQQFAGFKHIVGNVLGDLPRKALDFTNEGDWQPSEGNLWYKWDPMEDLFT